MLEIINSDLESAIRHDAAARNKFEVLLTYSGFHAITMHRLAHFLHVHNYKLLARILRASKFTPARRLVRACLLTTARASLLAKLR